jgi:transcriptional/translational regulatory protein YebC/TACO1
LLTYAPGCDDDALMAAAIEAGAEDIVAGADKSVEVLTDPADFETVRNAMREAGFPADDAELTLRATTTVALEAEEAGSMLRMIDMLEDLDDVQNVYSNAEIGDAVLSQIRDQF